MSNLEDGQHYTRSLGQRKLTCGHQISYRFRLVSISCDPAYNFSIDSHQLTVIEADGINVKPLVVDSLEIFAGM